jgi:alcohol dehydrogenase (cytochrome c)
MVASLFGSHTECDRWEKVVVMQFFPRGRCEVKARLRTKLAAAAACATLVATAAVLAVVLPAGSAAAAGANVDWPYWGGTTQNTRYADIDQVNASNVNKLGVAFTLKAGPNQTDWETDPEEVNGVLYYTTNTDQVFAVSATTGKKIWSYTPKVNFFLAIAGGGGGVPTSRGLTIYNGKVYDLTFDDQLIALQQATGEKLWSTTVANAEAGVSETSPGTIYAPSSGPPQYIVGSAESDAGIRGAVQSFNANTGKLLWRTWLVPSPGHGWMPATGDHGGGDVWMPPTVDPTTGTVIVGTGNPSPDFDVSVRGGPHAADPWTDATVAINAKTGKIMWGHTEVFGDGWDYDTHQAPSLFTIKVNGKTINAVGQGNKSGFYSILNEQTGKLIAKSPYVEPYSKPHRYATAKGVKVCPGASGGLEFSPPTVDPQTNYVYAQSLNECAIYTLQSQKETATHTKGQPDFGGSFAPAPGPTSGGFTAINDTTGKIMWKDHLPREAEGGAMSTSGGLVFFGDGTTPSSPNQKLEGWLEAASATTGKIVWKASLGVPITAAPMTYEVNGTQYIAIAADSDLVVFKLGGSPIKKLTPAVPQSTTPSSHLPNLKGYSKANAYTYYDSAKKQVVFKMTAGIAGKNGGFNFDGYYGGEANYEVPVGWVATFEFSNVSSVPHSLELTDSLKTPPTPILNPLSEPQAVPADPTAGLKGGAGTAVLSYNTTKAQSLYLVCGVVGHLQAGMWDRMTVSSSYTKPAIVVGTPTKKLP